MISPDGQLSEEEAFRLTSLRFFLQIYRRLRPDVVSELQARVIPPFRESFRAHIVGGQTTGKGEAVQKALESWILDFGLPNTVDVKVEAIRTLLTPSPSAGPAFWWESAMTMIEAMAKEGSPGRHSPETIYSHHLTFQAHGWTPSRESPKQARHRLREEFERALSEHMEASQRTAKANLAAFLKLEPTLARHLRWLAFKQAYPDCSLRDFKRKYKCSIDTVRRGLHSAADCLGLPRECIRQAPAGRKRRPRST